MKLDIQASVHFHRGITYRASGLSRQRVRYLPCAVNLVTAWKRGSPEFSSFTFQTKHCPYEKYKGMFFERVHQATMLLPATKHEPSAASVIDFIGVSPAGVFEFRSVLQAPGPEYPREKTH